MNNMPAKRISDKMEQALNEQLTRESFQSQVYLVYASWAEVNGFGGIADFLYKHSHEERQHMLKFLRYINNRGGKAKIVAIDQPGSDPGNLRECLERTLQHEIDNSKSIDAIVNLALEEKDWATFNFGQWFVKEQIEEETLVNDLLDKFNLATHGNEKFASLYTLDRDTADAPQHAPLPRESSF
jgi:ferritin